MTYRAWPAAALSGAAMVAACVVVGDHIAQSGDHCLGSAGWFTATAIAVPAGPVTADIDAKSVPYKIGLKGPTIDLAGESAPDPGARVEQISGCLDVDRIEVPATSPADGRA